MRVSRHFTPSNLFQPQINFFGIQSLLLFSFDGSTKTLRIKNSEAQNVPTLTKELGKADSCRILLKVTVDVIGLESKMKYCSVLVLFISLLLLIMSLLQIAYTL